MRWIGLVPTIQVIVRRQFGVALVEQATLNMAGAVTGGFRAAYPGLAGREMDGGSLALMSTNSGLREHHLAEAV